MNIGITTLVGHTESLENFFKKVSALGYQYIELNCVRDYFAHCNAMQLADSPGDLARLKQLLDENNLKCSAVDCHGLFGRSAEEVLYSQRYLEAGMEVAVKLGSPLVITSIPGGAVTRPEMITAVRELCGKAEKLGLEIAVEAEYAFAVDPDTLESFLDEVNAPNLKVNFDPNHFARANWEVEDAVRKFFPRISHVHLKEHLPETPYPTRFTGTVGSPAYRMLDELVKLGFNGVISAETLAELDELPEDPAAVIMEGIKKYQQNQCCTASAAN